MAGQERVHIVLNRDQAEFKQLVLDFMSRMTARDRSVSMLNYTGPGYSYQDYVVTVKADRARRTCEVYRNRTGALVFAMVDMEPVAVNWQYIFLDGHMAKKLKELDG